MEGNLKQMHIFPWPHWSEIGIAEMGRVGIIQKKLLNNYRASPLNVMIFKREQWALRVLSADSLILLCTFTGIHIQENFKIVFNTRVFEKNLPLFQNFWKTNLEFNTSFVCWDSCRKRLAELTPLLKGRLGTEMLRRLDAALLASFHLGAQAVHSCKPLRRAAGGRKPAKFSSGNSYKVEP